VHGAQAEVGESQGTRNEKQKSSARAGRAPRRRSPLTRRSLDVFSSVTVQLYITFDICAVHLLGAMWSPISRPFTRLLPRQWLRNIRRNSTSPATPPLMGKIRADLKQAMKSKDTTRCGGFTFTLISDKDRERLTRLYIQTRCPTSCYLRHHQCF
jgi:hypothetical protein